MIPPHIRSLSAGKSQRRQTAAQRFQKFGRTATLRCSPSTPNPNQILPTGKSRIDGKKMQGETFVGFDFRPPIKSPVGVNLASATPPD